MNEFGEHILPPVCFTCKHYIQHHIWDGKLHAINHGRCLEKHSKVCSPERKACANWEEQSEDYRSKRLAPVAHILVIKGEVFKVDNT